MVTKGREKANTVLKKERKGSSSSSAFCLDLSAVMNAHAASSTPTTCALLYKNLNYEYSGKIRGNSTSKKQSEQD